MSRALCKIIDENLSEYIKKFEGIAKHGNFKVTWKVKLFIKGLDDAHYAFLAGGQLNNYIVAKKTSLEYNERMRHRQANTFSVFMANQEKKPAVSPGAWDSEKVLLYE